MWDLEEEVCVLNELSGYNTSISVVILGLVIVWMDVLIFTTQALNSGFLRGVPV
jgi:hypothetical protein